MGIHIECFEVDPGHFTVIVNKQVFQRDLMSDEALGVIAAVLLGANPRYVNDYETEVAQSLRSKSNWRGFERGPLLMLPAPTTARPS